MLKLATFAAFISIAGCAVDTDSGTMTKEEAAKHSGKADDGTDFCEMFHWYGDGTCDMFCPKPDPDCGPVATTCDAAGGRCMTSFQFPTTAPSCETEYNVKTLQGSCPQINQSCCATH